MSRFHLSVIAVGLLTIWYVVCQMEHDRDKKAACGARHCQHGSAILVRERDAVDHFTCVCVEFPTP